MMPNEEMDHEKNIYLYAIRIAVSAYHSVSAFFGPV